MVRNEKQKKMNWNGTAPFIPQHRVPAGCFMFHISRVPFRFVAFMIIIRTVRRGDAAMPRQLRRYASVQEYLDVGHVEEGAHIMLLTDDNSVIEEIHKYHPNYQWTYVERQRQQGGDGGWQGHIPSGDGPWEFIVMETELRLASECEELVYGRSGFMKGLQESMDAQGKNYTAHRVETGVSLEEAAAWPKEGKDLLPFFIKQMDEYRRMSKAKRENRTATS